MTRNLLRFLRITARFPIALAVLMGSFVCSRDAATAQTNQTVAKADTTVVLDRSRFDLAKRDDLHAFVKAVKDLSKLSKEEHQERKDEKRAEKKGEPKETHPHGRDWSETKVRHGLKAMEQIAEGLQENKIDPVAGIHDIQEIDWAVEHNFVTPYTWVKSLDPIEALFHVRDVTLNACGRGNSKEPASNLLTYDAADLSKVDPKPSTFWSRPATIADKDLYAGFDRPAIPDFTDSICTYDGPHKGYGIHPSFEVVWHDTHWKVKFGEERSSGPFACRIFWALGFPAEIVDYTPQVKVRWDRRILTDFNARQENAMKITLLGLPIATVHPTRYFDPFDFIRVAVLKDGSRLAAQQLRERLFPSDSGHHRPRRPEKNPALFDMAFEKQIDYLVMNDASVTSKESEGVQDLGFWGYNALDHPMLREVRAMAVLNAWLDNWDIRWGNNRLELIQESNGAYRLQHIVSDLGALFGNSSGMVRPVHGRLKFGAYQNAPNDFGWAFTQEQAPGKTCVPIHDYMPIVKTRPFYLMNLDDARWMARLIAQLTEAQIKQALIGAGYDGAEARLLVEKLVARRDQMIKDLGLSGEIAPLRPQGVDRKLTYDPRADGPVEAVRRSGQTVVARNTGEYIVIAGALRPNRQSAPTRTALAHP